MEMLRLRFHLDSAEPDFSLWWRDEQVDDHLEGNEAENWKY
jgi:hypothetical protein